MPVVSWIMMRVRIWEKQLVACGILWLLRVIDHEAVLMDPKLFSSWVHSSQVSGVVEAKVWTAPSSRCGGGAAREKLIE
jgi:hypothetical protein